MEFKEKKPIFNAEDTHSLESTLSPIIVAALKKLLSVLKEREEPEHLFDLGGSQLDNEDYFLVLEKMIYAFDSTRPVLGSGIIKMQGNLRRIIILDHDAYDEYQKECKSWDKRKKEGIELFAMYYDVLGW